MNLDLKTILGILLVTALVALAVMRAFRQTSDDALRHDGRVATAETVSVVNTGVRFRHGPEVEITVRFQAAGQVHTATFKETATVAVTSQLRPGAPIEIVYDPADPARVALRSP